MSGLNVAVAVAHLRFEKHPGFSKGPRLDPYLTFSGRPVTLKRLDILFFPQAAKISNTQPINIGMFSF